jgi:hypothetical protein
MTISSMMSATRVTHEAVLWRWTGTQGGNWHFVTIDGAAGEALSATALMEKLERGRARGFGSVKVTVRIGGSQWATSAFPSKGEGWIIPVKAAVRKAENLVEGDSAMVDLTF